MEEQIGRTTKNYYQVMGLAPSASRVEIKEAYLRLKTTYGHGSAALYSLMEEDEAQENLELIEEAYRILDNDYRRQEYDRTLGYGAAPLGGPAVDAADLEEPRTVITSRSTLSVIKTVASGVHDVNVQETFKALIDSGDPGDGDLFRCLREAAKVPAEEMQARTKISAEYMAAIESNCFDRLPQVVYVKGFLRSYFRYIGVSNAEVFVEAFAARLMEWQKNGKN